MKFLDKYESKLIINLGFELEIVKWNANEADTSNADFTDIYWML